MYCTKVPDRPEWIHEIKHDGYRLIIQRGASARAASASRFAPGCYNRVLAQIILSLAVSSSTKAGMMAEINKLSVEKTLNKIRADDAKQSKEGSVQ